MNIKELISMTIACGKCKGTGQELDDKSTSGTKNCEACTGSGMVIDNTIPDTIREFAEGISNGDLGRCTEKIYQHYGDKLVDAYNRGIEDGRVATTEAVKEQMKKGEETKEVKK